MRVLKAIYRFFSGFAVTKWWPFGSTLRFRKAIRDNISIQLEDCVSTLEDIEALALRVYRHFDYTEDGPDQLWDAITPPPQNYFTYIGGTSSVQDDCDGFHSTVYHCLRNSDIPCYLLSVVSPSGCHCVLVFNLNGLWHVLDYTHLYPGHLTLKDAVLAYNKAYTEKYRHKHDVWYNALVSYDYSKKRFIGVTLPKVRML